MRNTHPLIPGRSTFKINGSGVGIQYELRCAIVRSIEDERVSATCPSGAVVAQPICNRQVGGFESPLGLQDHKKVLLKAGLRKLDDELRLSDANAAVLMLGLPFGAGVGEWLNPADCKSAAVRLRRFESYPLHQSTRALSAPQFEAHIAQR